MGRGKNKRTWIFVVGEAVEGQEAGEDFWGDVACALRVEDGEEVVH
jgi:hypothetical protein